MTTTPEELLKQILDIATIAGWKFGNGTPLVEWLAGEMASLKRLQEHAERVEPDLVRLAILEAKEVAP